MGNFKLFKDFGVTAWFGTLVITGSFVLLGVVVVRAQVDFNQILPMIGSWVGSIITAYFVLKGTKNGRNGG